MAAPEVLVVVAAGPGLGRSVALRFAREGAAVGLVARSIGSAEALAEELGGVVVRPGLLYGPGAGGMIGMLTRLVRALPVVPVLVGEDRPLYLAHQDDAAELIARVAAVYDATGGNAADPMKGDSATPAAATTTAAPGCRRNPSRQTAVILHSPL